MATEKPAEKTKPLEYKALLRTYLKLYCDRSTVHGVRYLFSNDLNEIERICWTAIVVCSIAITFTSFFVLSERYNDQLLLTVVENSQYPVFNVPFPAVAICNQRRVNWNKFEEAKSIFLPKNAPNETRAVFTEFVKRMESLRFGAFYRFNDLEDVDLEKLDFVNVTQLSQFLSFRCEDMFNGDCLWRRENLSCCDMFVMEKTEVGFCLVFNSAISGESRKKVAEDKFYPLRNAKAGENSGLDIKIKFNGTSTGSDVDDGIFLMVKKPEQWSDVVYSVKGNTDTLVVVRPEVTDTDLTTRDVPAEIRGCIFDSEKSNHLYKGIEGLKYWQWNCFNACHEEYMLNYCNCTLSMFFPYNETRRECKPADFRCLYKFRDIFSFDKRLNEESYVKNVKGGMLCPCLISCDALEYFITVYVAIQRVPLLRGGYPTAAFFITESIYINCIYSYIWYKPIPAMLCYLEKFSRRPNASKIITIDVHFQNEVMLKYRTSREFTYLELIASLGGIIGLFLGASIVSGIEIIYHLTFGLFVFLKDNHIFERMAFQLRKCFSRNRISSATSSASSTIPKVAWHSTANTRRY